MLQTSDRAVLSSPDSSWKHHLTSLPEPLVTGLLLLLWLLATSWLRPLSLPDEGRYVGVAWEMVRSGDWLTPTLNGLPYFHKPPLFYWLTAASLSLFGNIEWAARMASALGAMLGAGAGYLLLRRWMSASLSRWYLVVLATTPLFFGGSQYANHDMLVAGFISMAIALTADAVLSIEAGRYWRLQLAGGWISAALGLLSKGLIGIVLPGGVIFFWLVLSGRWRMLLKLFWWPAPLLFLLVGAPWFVLMQQKFPDFFHYFFIYQHFQRFSQGSFNNVQPFWFYFAVLALTALPWSPWLIARYWLDKGNQDSSSHASARGVRLLFWIWLILITAFFSIPSSKLVGYVLPVMPALIALATEGMMYGARVREGWRITLVLGAALLCVGSVIAITRADDISTKPLAEAYLQQAAPGEPLVFLQTYRFDAPFYAKLPAPVVIMDKWDEPILKDSWPKELADASRFRPELGKQVLVNTPEMQQILCANTVNWVISPADYIESNAKLSSLQPVARNKLYVLLRIPSSFAPLECR